MTPPASPESFRPRQMPLTEMPVGSSGRVHSLQGEAGVCSRLREMGFCESAEVAKISGEKTLVCQVCGTRIALSDRAATHIVVQLAESCPSARGADAAAPARAQHSSGHPHQPCGPGCCCGAADAAAGGA